jgi:hypothetical protein
MHVCAETTHMSSAFNSESLDYARMHLPREPVEEATASDPMDLLIALEEQLMEDHGLTFMQAVRAGVIAQREAPLSPITTRKAKEKYHA